jgi:hypothetical protein
MAGTKVDTVRAGVSLLKQVLRSADEQGNWNGRVSKGEVKSFKSNWGDGAELDNAIDALHKFAAARSGHYSPTMSDVGNALQSAMRTIAKADVNGNGYLSMKEIDAHADAKTWRAIIEFAKTYRGSTVDDIVQMGHE